MQNRITWDQVEEGFPIDLEDRLRCQDLKMIRRHVNLSFHSLAPQTWTTFGVLFLIQSFFSPDLLIPKSSHQISDREKRQDVKKYQMKYSLLLLLDQKRFYRENFTRDDDVYSSDPLLHPPSCHLIWYAWLTWSHAIVMRRGGGGGGGGGGGYGEERTLQHFSPDSNLSLTSGATIIVMIIDPGESSRRWFEKQKVRRWRSAHHPVWSRRSRDLYCPKKKDFSDDGVSHLQ